MKLPIFSAFGLALFTGTLFAATQPPPVKTATPVKIDPKIINDKPYRYNGVVLTGVARGSGFCAWSSRTFFTAAHVVFDLEAGKWEAPPSWTSTVNSKDVDPKKTAKSRGYYRWTDYAQLATANDPDQNDFSRDVAIGFSLKELIQGNPASLNLNGFNDLKEKKSTIITGYPADNLYIEKDIEGYYLHKTGPVITPYESYSGKALTTTLVTTGHGNSGGPIWIGRSSRSDWLAAGVVVGGRPSETIVYAFSSDINALLRAVAPVVQKSVESPISSKEVGSSSLFFPFDRTTPIPDGVKSWTTFNISASQLPRLSTVKNVRLTVKIQTKHKGDLVVMLQAPSGITQIVHNEEGAGEDNLVIPQMDLTERFADTPANGTWKVLVQDRLKGDKAFLKSILLEIAVQDEVLTGTP